MTYVTETVTALLVACWPVVMNLYAIFGLSIVISCFFSLPVLAQSEAHCFVFTVGPLTAEGTVIRLCPTMDGRIYKEPK